MRIALLSLAGALGLAASVAAATAAPAVPPAAPGHAANIVPVAGGCGRGFHRTYRGHCLPNHHYRHRYYHHYRHYYYRRYSGYYPRYPYYGYNPWYGPSPNDYVADRLNAEELGQRYRGY